MPDRTITESAPAAPSGPRKVEARLGVIVVCTPAGGGPTAHEVEGGLLVGREPSSGIATGDASCSREHLRLRPTPGGIEVLDLESRNGTFVDGSRIGREPALASKGSVIRAGRTLLVVADVAPYAEERPDELPGLVGGASLDDARFRIETIAPTDSPVLVLGETGTGKEVVGRLLHERSGRAGPFVALNCAAVPKELVDAELFGHARGAFSGALTARAGQFRTAEGGTLLLDEIGEMPAPVQAKLLRALETGEIRPVGDDRTVEVDVRIVAATNRNVDELLESGAFRADLLHRLAGLRIELPPLRDRREDIPALAQHFASQAGARVSAPALEKLIGHRFAGNVRELRNLMGAAAPIARQRGHAEIELEDVASLLTAPAKEAGRSAAPTEDERLRAALEATSGQVAEAAKLLGMSRSVLYETLRRLAIDPREYRRR